MSKPTLMLAGNLVAGNPDRQRELDMLVPIEYILDWFRARLHATGLENRVLILKSKTASGKSTTMPPRLYEAFLHSLPPTAPGLICTQPRRITAIKNVLEILIWNSAFLRLGQNCGWLTQYDKVAPAVKCSMLSATLQTLTQQLKTMTDDEICDRYQFILIDECHERSMQLDLTVYILKNFIARNAHKTNCPFVCLMSATFDETVFLKYFGLDTGPDSNNFICVQGLSQPREQRRLFEGDETSQNLNADIVRAVRDIIDRGEADEFGRRDILIFLPGANNPDLRKMFAEMNADLVEADQADQVCSVLQVSSDAQENETFEYLSLDSIGLASQLVEIDSKKYIPRRRIIISTNIAETGLTLSELKYMIDAGFNNETEFNPLLGIQYLALKAAPQSRIAQRIGRVGRKFAGVYYLMYPDSLYDRLQVNQWPDILTNDITEVLLDIIIEQMKAKARDGRPMEFALGDVDLLDVPSIDAFRYSLEKLYTLGLVSPLAPTWSPELFSNNLRPSILERETIQPEQFSITQLGTAAAKMLSPSLGRVESARMILAGFTFGAAITDLITIAVWLPHGPNDIAADKVAGINWDFIYGSAHSTAINAKAGIKLRAILADQFIEGLLLFNSFIKTIADNKARAAWFAKSGVSEHFFIKRFLTERESLIEHLLGSEIAVYRNEDRRLSLVETADEWLARVKALKHAIYDGYRHNLIEYKSEGNNRDKKHYSRTAQIDEPKFLQRDKKGAADSGIAIPAPRYMCGGRISLAQREIGKEVHRRIKVDLVSVMDNFVGVDDKFNI